MGNPFENDYNIDRLESLVEELNELGYGFYGAVYKLVEDNDIPVFDMQILDGCESSDEKVAIVSIMLTEDDDLKPLDRNQYVFVN